MAARGLRNAHSCIPSCVPREGAADTSIARSAIPSKQANRLQSTNTRGSWPPRYAGTSGQSEQFLVRETYWTSQPSILVREQAVTAGLSPKRIRTSQPKRPFLPEKYPSPITTDPVKLEAGGMSGTDSPEGLID